MTNNLLLQKDIYCLNAIKEAVRDYCKLARIDLTENKNYYICSFSSCMYDKETTKKEFGNYLIDLMNSKR